MTRATRHRLEAAAAAVVSGLVRALPRRATGVLGRAMGGAWARLDPRHVAIAEDNLARAFPDWDAARRRETAKGVYRHFAQVVLELLWLAGRPRDRVLSLVDLEGAEHVEKALARGRGALIVTAHLGNWELHGLAHGWRFGPLDVIARPLDNPALDRRLCGLRTMGGNRVVYKRHALGEVLRTVRAGGMVAVLVDQNVQEKDGVFVDFFGRPAATTTVAAAIALKTGAALVPAFSERRKDGRYVLRYEPEVEVRPGGGGRAEDLHRVTQDLTARIEAAVRQRPEQWLWIHRRWKTQPGATAPVPREAAS